MLAEGGDEGGDRCFRARPDISERYGHGPAHFWVRLLGEGGDEGGHRYFFGLTPDVSEIQGGGVAQVGIIVRQSLKFRLNLGGNIRISSALRTGTAHCD
jgi:hypothetical protein